MQLTRGVMPSDESFLLELYVFTREHEVEAWGWGAEEKFAFLQMQWRMQTNAYRLQYPEADHRIVLEAGEAVGRILVHRGPEGITLVDISLLPAFRGRGMGSRLIRELQEEAKLAGVPMRLRVRTGNPAMRLYERLGFQAMDRSELDVRMIYGASESVQS